MVLILGAGIPAECTDEMMPVDATSVKMATNIHLAIIIKSANCILAILQITAAFLGHLLLCFSAQ